MNRRDFLKGSVFAAAGMASGDGSHGAPEDVQDARAGASGGARRPAEAAVEIIDTNVHLARWPFRRLPYDETPRLVAKLRRHGIRRAWAGSFDGLLHEDIALVNARLTEDCRRNGDGVLVPFGSVNPTFPDWEDDLRRAEEEHGMPGIRLHPGYHGYGLDHPAFARLLRLAAERGLVVQLAVLMEDERTQHPLLQVPHVDVRPLSDALEKAPGARVELLNWSRAVRGRLLERIIADGRVFLDTGSVEGIGGVGKLLDRIPEDRLLFGSHAPFFILEAALLRMRESPLAEAEVRAILAGNARAFLAPEER